MVEYAAYGQKTDSFDILQFAKIDAALTSARYYQNHMLLSKNFTNDLQCLEHALSICGHEGLYLEFGVASGRTVNHIANVLKNEKIYGFDSFDGLPEDWRTGFSVGAFKKNKLPETAANVKLISGLFEDTLPTFLQNNSGDIAFMHIDCDLYSSTKTILDLCQPRIKHGTVIVFDEYLNYPGYQHHEFMAWKQFVDEHALSYRYEGFVSCHQQVSIRVE
jgi:predicted O-methyltransferase YrrM